MNEKQNVWFITGGNKGLGAAIVQEALAEGNKVVATARSIESARQTLGEHPNLLLVKLDITNNEQVETAVSDAIAKFGRIDVLVNNAGYGLLGYFEEMSDELIQHQMKTNVFGTMNITRAILPLMRQQGSGLVIVVSSTSGIKAVRGGSVYSASKFALEGWAEGMNLDLQPFGIRFMILEPGGYRTDFANENASMQLPDLKVDGYEHLRDELAAHFKNMNGQQSGDPAKLAAGLLQVTNSENPPLRLLIGKGAIPAVDEYYKKRYSEFQRWQAVSANSDFEE
ncbi:MAG: SDR family NAD(P)-dependent oxidoreductase [Dyadobacter sp.]|uniref:SDR family NAD(P)-dependent oxidoreductase n=1 Tax=Dyadobacter sp. TaxID=1914288 RepID=UPI001B059E5C|nr:SDR family NAD(P)-dependent oxidoreductase [Dyadobacter sp.]MBO9616242.1 SDR family NAD(P)-dependent oxidoreductase [Dyadobacter sp.]